MWGYGAAAAVVVIAIVAWYVVGWWRAPKEDYYGSGMPYTAEYLRYGGYGGPPRGGGYRWDEGERYRRGRGGDERYRRDVEEREWHPWH